MSFRELRNFTEMMRALGYHRPISMENFRTPNFELVSDILYWLVKRYEPNADVSNRLDSMQDRVIFLKQCATLMASKGRIKLNPKRLYQADGYAVKELIKIAQVLYSSMQSNPDDDDDLLGGDTFSIKPDDLKNVRDLAADITQHGAGLAELLAKEDQLREARQRAISRDMQGSDEVERFIMSSIAAAQDNQRSKEKLMEDLKTDEASLEKKITKKAAELERNRKRLESLQNVRPAFMDAYEKLEDELQDLYRDYLERFRNLDYIENQLETHNKQEQERMEENEKQMKRMQKKLKEDELKVLRGDVQLDENDLEDTLMDDDDSDSDDLARPQRGGERPKTKSGARSQVVGSLNGLDNDSGSGSDSDEGVSMSGDDSGDMLDDDSDQGSEGVGGTSDEVSNSVQSDESEHDF